MPLKVYNQIQFLCREIAKVEWSGVLFYRVEGSIQDPKNMKLILEDILPMHKGTSTYTEYSFDERVIDHMMDNEYLEDCKMGHIHSHNTMGVFFSGTDWSELEDNAPNHNFYLSLIVNNFMDFCAKVCFITEASESKEFNFYAKDEKGEKYKYTTEEYEVPDKKLVVYDCEISHPSKDIVVEEVFSDKVKSIIAKANIVTTANTYKAPNNSYTAYGGGAVDMGKHTNHQSPGTRVADGGIKRWNSNTNIKTSSNYKTSLPDSIHVPTMMVNNKDWYHAIDEFAMYLLNTGNTTEEYADVDDILEFYLQSGMTPGALSSKILTDFSNIYEVFFRELPERNEAETVVMITEAVIVSYKEEIAMNLVDSQIELLTPVVEGLEKTLRLFKSEFI